MEPTLANANDEVKQLLIYHLLNARLNAGMNMPAVRRRRLKELIAKEYNQSRKAFCDATGISESRLAQLLSETYRDGGEFGEKAARALELKAGLETLYFDKIEAEMSVEQERETYHRRSTDLSASSTNKNNIKALHPDDALSDQEVSIKQSKVYFSSGPGREATYEIVEDSEPATYQLSWFQKHRINPDKVRRFKVTGDSNEPMLFEGDTVLVNLSETNIVDGKLYAIRYSNDLRLKFLSRRLDGTLILRSKNSEYKDEEIPPEMAEEHITVIGRVRDKSGSGGL